jgi:hypothetical protein
VLKHHAPRCYTLALPPDPAGVPKLSLVGHPFLQVAVSLSGACILSAGLLALEKRPSDLPWNFVPFLLLLSLPCALVLVAMLGSAGRLRQIPTGVWSAVGTLAVWYSAPHVLWPISAFLGVALVKELRSARFVGQVAMLVTLLVVGYVAVWNFNSLLAPLSVGRLADPSLITFDRWLLFSPTYVGVFPIFNSALAFALLERSYLFLFAEILVVVIWMAAFQPRQAYWWIARLFTAYGIGLVIFLIWPTVGPHIYAPDSLRSEWHHTTTFRTMQSMAIDYQRIVGGGRGGMNYFIAFPSLHVAAAVTCQLSVRGSRPVFWALLPVTVLVSSSTFLLGYHYALDVPGGVLTAFLAWWCIDRFRSPDRPSKVTAA